MNFSGDIQSRIKAAVPLVSHSLDPILSLETQILPQTIKPSNCWPENPLRLIPISKQVGKWETLQEAVHHTSWGQLQSGISQRHHCQTTTWPEPGCTLLHTPPPYPHEGGWDQIWFWQPCHATWEDGEIKLNQNQQTTITIHLKMGWDQIKLDGIAAQMTFTVIGTESEV